jgi:predicted TIM-barrel fold metal-dependent hydrolase
MLQAPKPRYRGILGGLDNAVKEAEARGFYDMMIVDADCHFEQPLKSFTKYLSKYNKQWELPEDTQSMEYLSQRRSAAFGTDKPGKDLLQRSYGRRVRRPESGSSKEEPKEAAIDRFTQRMYDIGIKRSVVFPAALVYNLGMLPDHPLEVAIGNAFVDFMLDNFLGKYKEILSVIPAPANTPDKAAELIDRAGSEKGIVGVIVSPNRPVPLGDDFYNPIYEAAQKKGLPILVHSGIWYGDPFTEFGKNLPIFTLNFPFGCLKQATSVIVEGVPERFKNLKWMWVEGGVTWIPFLMYRLNNFYERMRDEAPLLRKMPSEYLKEFYYSSQPLEQSAGAKNLQWMFEQFDAENQLLYASDYPHHDFDLPSTIYDLPFLSREAKKKILGENAIKLFKLN